MKLKRLYIIVPVVLAIVIVIEFVSPAVAAASPFSDVPSDNWAYQYVERAYEDGIMTGTYVNNVTGERLFSPNASLTMAEFSVMIARAWYGDEISSKTEVNWYNRQQEVLQNHDIYKGLGSLMMNTVVSRYQMAVMIYNTMLDQGAKMPTDAELATVQSKITDWNSIPTSYRKAVNVCYYLGIINGMGGNLGFQGDATMTRNAAAAVYCRMTDAITALKQNVDSVPPSDHGTQPSNSVVGTISDKKVVLGLDTHKPVTDYWSQQPASTQNVANRDAFNAAVQTRIDTKVIQTQGTWPSTGVNPYYNYAVYAWEAGDQSMLNVNQAMANSMDSFGTYSSKAGSGAITYYVIKPHASASQLETIFASYLAQISNAMNDAQKVQICVKAVTDKLTYQVNGGATWTNGKTTGDCNNFRNMIGQLLSAVGIPNVWVNGYTAQGSHAWLQVFVDGQWVIVDGVVAESRGLSYATMSFAQHESLYGYNHSINDSDVYRIARAIMEYPVS